MPGPHGVKHASTFCLEELALVLCYTQPTCIMPPEMAKGGVVG